MRDLTFADMFDVPAITIETLDWVLTCVDEYQLKPFKTLVAPSGILVTFHGVLANSVSYAEREVNIAIDTKGEIAFYMLDIGAAAPQVTPSADFRNEVKTIATFLSGQ